YMPRILIPLRPNLGVLHLMAVFDWNQLASLLSEEDDVAASNSHVVPVSSLNNTRCDSFASHDDNASYE
ncbi:hypothetical protein Tco_0279602, partial [Tanacetum coccineum]